MDFKQGYTTDPYYMLRNGEDFAIPGSNLILFYIFRTYGINLNQCLKTALLTGQRFPVI